MHTLWLLYTRLHSADAAKALVNVDGLSILDIRWLTSVPTKTNKTLNYLLLCKLRTNFHNVWKYYIKILELHRCFKVLNLWYLRKYLRNSFYSEGHSNFEHFVFLSKFSNPHSNNLPLDKSTDLQLLWKQRFLKTNRAVLLSPNFPCVTWQNSSKMLTQPGTFITICWPSVKNVKLTRIDSHAMPTTRWMCLGRFWLDFNGLSLEKWCKKLLWK